jgi:hypothetical protein
MATVFTSIRRVTVNSNDHEPAHVQAYGKGLEARFKLNCPDGPVEYWDHGGPWRFVDLSELGEEIARAIAACCDKWREIHGQV